MDYEIDDVRLHERWSMDEYNIRWQMPPLLHCEQRLRSAAFLTVISRLPISLLMFDCYGLLGTVH
jgi:hypothetical protein